jgi:hypothetical protein
MTKKSEIAAELLEKAIQLLEAHAAEGVLSPVYTAKEVRNILDEALVAERLGEPVWVFTDEDGQLCVTDRWDVAKHLPFETIQYTQEQPALIALREENRILRERLKVELAWSVTCHLLSTELTQIRQDYRDLSVENDHLLDLASGFEQRNSELVELLGEVKESPTVLELGVVPKGWFSRRDAALAAKLSDEEPGRKYAFVTEAYGVALSQEQWSAVHGVFARHNESDCKEEEFKISESDINGLVSEILVELDLARGE